MSRTLARGPARTTSGATAGVKSAERAMRVLAVLARYARPVPTMMLARECDIPKSSVHHLLNSLRAGDFVVYYESERAWGLGIAVFELGSAYLRSKPLQRLGRPLLVALTAATGHTSHLAILHGHEALYLDKERPAGGGPALVTEVGVRLPAHLTAVGQAILASLPDAQLGAIYGHGDLVSRTGVGGEAMDALRARLAEARDRGWAYEEAMTSDGICCAAAPVISHEGFAVASVGVTFAMGSVSGDDVKTTAGVVCAMADRLSANLGGSSAWLIDRATPG
jgi:DNA-binding IclR family transcriptional regulator